MITDIERFIRIQELLVFSSLSIKECTFMTNLIIDLSKEIEKLKEQVK